MATSDERRPVGVRFTPATLAQLDAIAAATGLTRSDAVRLAVAKLLERGGPFPRGEAAREMSA